MTVQLRTTAADLTCTIARPRLGGLAEGTMVMTARGAVAVQDLSVGDRIITRDRGMQVLRAVTQHRLDALALFRILPDTLGAGRPEAETLVAPGQHLYLRDWRAQALFGADAALVPAWRLADGHFVAEQAPAPVVIHELHFDHEHVIYANGLELGTGRVVADILARAA